MAEDIFNIDDVELIKAVNWNEVSDLDKEIWDRLVSNFWIDTKISISNDLPSWANLTESEKDTTAKVLMGLTLLDTIQSNLGAVSLMPDARTPHEEAILTNIAFMESIHAKSYSTIFSTLLSTSETDEVFRWSRENDYLKRKGGIILKYYRGDDPLKRKIASVMLESFLFYSGFFMPLYWATKAKLTNTADMIRLIIRDEAVHGAYIGRKFQESFAEQSIERQNDLKDFTTKMMDELFENEMRYTESLYDEIGLTEEVKTFLRYNANKALNNLGFDSIFGKDETKVLTQILASLDPEANEAHDFFSAAGSSYKIITTEQTTDDDWDFDE